MYSNPAKKAEEKLNISMKEETDKLLKKRKL